MSGSRNLFVLVVEQHTVEFGCPTAWKRLVSFNP
jgi:uncharacterized protein YjeT (DUF2065 family)